MIKSAFRLLLGLMALASPAAAAPQISTVHAFSGGNDGSGPQSLVTDSTYLYVATNGNYPGNGTVNRFDPATGQMVLLHSFAPGVRGNSAPEGGFPGSLILAGGKIYGLAGVGGPEFGGTVFSIDPATGAFQTVYTFDDTTNGAYPDSIVQLGNALYIATAAGGPANSGTLVKIDLASGAGSVAYSFQNGADGAEPGELIVVGSQLFGVALTGGPNFADGKLFSFDPASAMVTTRYTFTDGADGGYPGGLSFEDGQIYGFASGGTRSTIGVGFSFDPVANTEATWLTFKPGTNNCEGFSAPVAFRRHLLASGTECGPASQDLGSRQGIIFTAAPATGKLHVLYGSAASGEIPNSVIAFNHIFYGTTYSNSTMGTIFKLIP